MHIISDNIIEILVKAFRNQKLCVERYGRAFYFSGATPAKYTQGYNI